MKRLRVLMTRQEIVPGRLADATVVVLDVFLATTTLLAILENGARGVYPVRTLEEAEELRRRLPQDTLRGGEQDAERIDGYDCGPFPEEYPPEVVAGRDVVFVTTNGTRALSDAAPAKRVVAGCLRNAPAVARSIRDSGTESVYLVCAGAGGRFALEDFLGAATIISHLDTGGWRLNDAAWLARDLAGRYGNETQEALRESRAGRWFARHDRMQTFGFVGDVGASGIVPEVVDGRLRRLEDPAGGRPQRVSGTAWRGGTGCSRP